MKKSITALCCAMVIVALAVATVGICYQNSSEKVQYDQSEPYFSDRVVNIISDDESAAPIESKLDKNTSKAVVKSSIGGDIQNDEIILIDGRWVSEQNNKTLNNEIQQTLLNGNPVIVIPDEAGVLYTILEETGKSLGFMVFDESYQIFGLCYDSQTGDVYCYSGVGYNEQLDSIPDAYLWAELALSDVYSKLSEWQETSYVDTKTTVCDPYGSVRVNSVYTDLNEDRQPHKDGYTTGYDVRYYIETMPNSYNGYRTADVRVNHTLDNSLNPGIELRSYFPTTGEITAPMFKQNSLESLNTKAIPTHDHSDFSKAFDITFDLDERDVMGAYITDMLAKEVLYIKSDVYNLNSNIFVTFCHMSYGLLGFENYDDYKTFEIKPAGYIGFETEA